MLIIITFFVDEFFEFPNKLWAVFLNGDIKDLAACLSDVN